MASTLREYLVDAKLAGEKTDDGYRFNTNETAADRAIAEVATWLYGLVAIYQRLADEAEDLTTRTILLVRVDTLTKAAEEVERG